VSVPKRDHLRHRGVLDAMHRRLSFVSIQRQLLLAWNAPLPTGHGRRDDVPIPVANLARDHFAPSYNRDALPVGSLRRKHSESKRPARLDPTVDVAHWHREHIYADEANRRRSQIKRRAAVGRRDRAKLTARADRQLPPTWMTDAPWQWGNVVDSLYVNVTGAVPAYFERSRWTHGPRG